MPSPQPTLRWLLFSPLPTHTVSGRVGASVTTPMLAVPCSSKMGVNDVPAFVVFHTPPYAVATYHVLLSRGCTAKSVMRPDVFAGPIDRNLRPEYVPALCFPAGLSDLEDFPDLGAGAATATPAARRSASSACGKRFMEGAVLEGVHGRPRGGAGRVRRAQWNAARRGVSTSRAPARETCSSAPACAADDANGSRVRASPRRAEWQSRSAPTPSTAPAARCAA